MLVQVRWRWNLQVVTGCATGSDTLADLAVA
jgi:hypothetical protein